MLIKLFAATLLSLTVASAEPSPIKHRFLAMDESRAQLVYTDQSDPAKNWAISFPSRYRDVQLIGDNKVLISTDNGYREYSLATRQVTKEVKGYTGITFARRRADGATVLGGNSNGVTIYELGADDKLLRQASFKFGGTRLGRLTPQGTVLFGSNTKLVEVSLTGQVIKELAPDDCKHLYMGLRKSDGHLLVTAGYGSCVLELDAEGKVLKRLGGLKTPEAKDLGYHFFGGCQVLKNGNIVVANWTGHGAKDSAKGVHLIEFDPTGKVVWSWHDPERTGSIHGVIILDDLDTSVLNDDVTGLLGAQK